MVRKSLAMIAGATLMAAPVAAQSQNSQGDERGNGGLRDAGPASVAGGGTATAALVAAAVIWLLTLLAATNNGNGPKQTSP